MPMVKGTNRIKGVLDVGVKQQISKGQSLYLTNDEFYEHKVQTALGMKFIICEEAAIQSGSGNKVRIKNTYKNSLSIGDTIRDLKPGQETVLDEDDLRSSHVQAAINKRMLKIVGSVNSGTESSKESTVKVGDVFKTKTPKAPKLEPVVINPSETPSSPELETNEEITGTPRVIEMDAEVITAAKPPPVNPIAKDPHKKTVVWNPAGNSPIGKPIENAVVIGNRGPTARAMPENDANFMDRVAKGEINSDGSPNPEFQQENPQANLIIDTNTPDEGPVTFVDQEQEQERIANHPKLNTVDPAESQELDFIG